VIGFLREGFFSRKGLFHGGFILLRSLFHAECAGEQRVHAEGLVLEGVVGSRKARKGAKKDLQIY
jgi:hypothetical protein